MLSKKPPYSICVDEFHKDLLVGAPLTIHPILWDNLKNEKARGSHIAFKVQPFSFDNNGRPFSCPELVKVVDSTTGKWCESSSCTFEIGESGQSNGVELMFTAPTSRPNETFALVLEPIVSRNWLLQLTDTHEKDKSPCDATELLDLRCAHRYIEIPKCNLSAIINGVFDNGKGGKNKMMQLTVCIKDFMRRKVLNEAIPLTLKLGLEGDSSVLFPDNALDILNSTKVTHNGKQIVRTDPQTGDATINFRVNHLSSKLPKNKKKVPYIITVEVATDAAPPLRGSTESHLVTRSAIAASDFTVRTKQNGKTSASRAEQQKRSTLFNKFDRIKNDALESSAYLRPLVLAEIVAHVAKIQSLIQSEGLYTPKPRTSSGKGAAKTPTLAATTGTAILTTGDHVSDDGGDQSKEENDEDDDYSSDDEEDQPNRKKARPDTGIRTEAHPPHVVRTVLSMIPSYAADSDDEEVCIKEEPGLNLNSEPLVSSPVTTAAPSTSAQEHTPHPDPYSTLLPPAATATPLPITVYAAGDPHLLPPRGAEEASELAPPADDSSSSHNASLDATKAATEDIAGVAGEEYDDFPSSSPHWGYGNHSDDHISIDLLDTFFENNVPFSGNWWLDPVHRIGFNT